MAILGPERPRVPIGISDYRELRRGGYTYVDKTRLVAGVIDAAGKSMLFPRPRRFGKTLNLSTMRYFLERSEEDRRSLFEDTYVWQAEGGRYRSHFQRYPVVYLTFKDVKARSWDEAWGDIRILLVRELRRLDSVGHIRLDDSGDVATRARLTDDAGPASAFKDMLSVVAEWCERAAGEQVVLLIDEYDAPLHAAWQYGYWEEAVAFFRAFLSAGYKDEARLFRGVLTGVLKVAKEGIFSGLNNVRTYSMLTPKGSTEFGFTETEVEALAHAAGRGAELEALRSWYDGYCVGGLEPSTIYNPWSILMYLAEPEAGMQPFWKNTSSNDLVHELLVRHAATVGPDIEALVRGECIDEVIDENVALQQVRTSPAALWSLLMFSGYLTAETARPFEDGFEVTLRIPNGEVAAVFRSVFARLVAEAAPRGSVDVLVGALLRGDTEELEAELESILVAALSSHDLGAKPVEAVYQAFIVGLLVHLQSSHRVTSNREAGHGRADVLIVPREAGGRGAVMELKVVGRSETPEQALERAVEQLRDRRYDEEVRAAGAGEVHQYAVVFDRKRCWVSRLPAASSSGLA